MSRRGRLVLVGAAGVAAAASVPLTQPARVVAQESLLSQAEHGTLQPRVVQTPHGVKTLPSISGAMATGLREAYLAKQNEASGTKAAARAAVGGGPAAAPQFSPGTSNSDGGNRSAGSDALGLSPGTLGCSRRLGGSSENGDAGNGGSALGNVRVNQDCTYRRQAEELIKYNPANPQNLVAGQNDSRVGYNRCGFDYSTNSGQTWGDGQPPFGQKENHPEEQAPKVPGDQNSHTVAGTPGTDKTYDFYSDPALAVDSQGRAFFGCVVIDLAPNEPEVSPDPKDQATGLLVTSSPPGAMGSFYNNITSDTRRRVVAEDNTPNVFHDKPFIAADFYKNSPNRDNVYVTWTVFKSNDTNCSNPNLFPVNFCSPIFGSMSTDHGLHWSTPEEISGVNPAACDGACNQDQGSDPIVLPDGSLVVTYNNGNTPSSINQQLAVKCHPSGDVTTGSAHFNCAPPNRVGFDVATGEPVCTDSGQCIPGNDVRTNDFPRIAINRDNPSHVFVTWQDYRNQEYDIQLSESTDGGVTWTEAAKSVNPDRGKDHYFPAIDVVSSPTGTGGDDRSGGSRRDHVGISYHRTDRVQNENAGTPFTPCPTPQTTPPTPCQPDVGKLFSDYSLSGGEALQTPYAFKVVSPRFPAPDGNQAGFIGDYSGLVIVNDVAHPIWADTRNATPYPPSSPDFQGASHDEDVFTVATSVPDNRGEGDNGGGLSGRQSGG